MNKQMLEEYFLELDEALSIAFPSSEPMSVIVVGGAFLILTDRINRQTDDVDVIITSLEGMEEASLVYELIKEKQDFHELSKTLDTIFGNNG